MRSPVRGFIWDVDGVFVNTEDLHWRSWERLFHELGYELSFETYAQLIGHPGKKNMATLCALFDIRHNQEELIRRRHAIFKELRVRGIPVLTQNADLVRAISNEYPNIIHAAASSSRSIFVRENLVNAGILGIMSAVISADDQDGIRRKPAPDLYLLAIQKLGIDPNELAAFEDSAAGVSSARAAGLRCVAIPNAMTASHDFSLANFVISHDAPRVAGDIIARLG